MKEMKKNKTKRAENIRGVMNSSYVRVQGLSNIMPEGRATAGYLIWSLREYIQLKVWLPFYIEKKKNFIVILPKNLDEFWKLN